MINWGSCNCPDCDRRAKRITWRETWAMIAALTLMCAIVGAVEVIR